jgi:hypothetical protein
MMLSAMTTRDEPRLASAWSALREILLRFSFADMKTLTASAGLPIMKLSHLRQTSGGGRSTGKGELADAIDGLFNDLDPDVQDRVTAHLISDLLRRTRDVDERLVELLERAGWTLIGTEPVPLRLRLDALPTPLPESVEGGLAKAARRYRDGDLDGAMTTIVGLVDETTGKIWATHALGDHKVASYHERVVKAHATREAAFRASLASMNAGEADRTWDAQRRTVNGAAEVLAAYRRNYADVHGAKSPDAELVEAALHAAALVIYSLSE